VTAGAASPPIVAGPEQGVVEPAFPDGAAARPAAPARQEMAPGGWYTVIVLALVAMLAQIDRGVISLVVQPMKRDLQLSDTQVSLLIGFAFTFFYALCGPPISRISDRGVRKNVIAASLTIWSLGTALCGLAQNFWAFFFARAVVGGAESGSSPATLSMMADVVPRHRLPRAFAIYNSGVMGGMALSLVFGGLLLGLLADLPGFRVPGIGTIHNWHLVFMILGLPGLLVAALLMITVPEPRRKGGHKAGGYPLKEVFGYIKAHKAMHGPLLLGVLIMSVQSFGISAWGPAFYERTYGWGPAVIGPILGLVTLGSSLLGLFIGAWLCEVLGKRRDDANLFVLFLAQILSIPFVAAAPLMPTPWLALSFSAVGGVIAGMGGPAYNAALQLSTPNTMRAQINALYLFTIAAVGGGMGPLLIALLTDFVAQSEASLRYVLVGFRLVLGPLDAVLIWMAIRHYRTAYRERLQADTVENEQVESTTGGARP
jgi:MFS family permease